MTKVEYVLPLPSSAIASGGARLRFSKNNTIVLICDWDDMENESLELWFEETQVMKCTFLSALVPEQIKLAYDTIVDVANSPWLTEVKQNIPSEPRSLQLRHLMLCFDDGPCYEFICGGFQAKAVPFAHSNA